MFTESSGHLIRRSEICSPVSFCNVQPVSDADAVASEIIKGMILLIYFAMQSNCIKTAYCNHHGGSRLQSGFYMTEVFFFEPSFPNACDIHPSKKEDMT